MRAQLTPVERKVYQYVLDYLDQHSFQPSLREVGRRFGLRSTRTVMEVFKRLEQKGYIERGASHARGVRLSGYAGPGGTQPVPLYRRAHAAPPVLRAEDVESHLVLDRRLLPGDDAFLARVNGYGALTHDARDGDLAIVSPTARASDGDLVAIRIGEELCVRAIEHDGARVRVRAIDSAGRDLLLERTDDYAVLGVVAAIVRPPA